MSTALQFGVSTWLWTSPFASATAEPLFKKIAAMGFDVVEIAVEDPALINVSETKALLRRYGLTALVCGAFGPSRDLTSDDESLQQTALRYIRACLSICEQLESPVFGGPMYSAVGKARLLPADKRKMEWDRAVQHLRTLAGDAEQHGVRLAIEPLNRFESDLVNNVHDALRLIGDIGHNHAGIMLDAFHMNIEEPDIAGALRAAGDKLYHLQVAENFRGTPGTGQTRWEDYRRGLEAIGYTGVISIESFTTDNLELADAVCFWRPMAASQDRLAEDGLHFLKKLFEGYNGAE
jgi:D-psicose/D-tagatose/L-ribulose 3-epimerase